MGRWSLGLFSLQFVFLNVVPTALPSSWSLSFQPLFPTPHTMTQGTLVLGGGHASSTKTKGRGFQGQIIWGAPNTVLSLLKTYKLHEHIRAPWNSSLNVSTFLEGFLLNTSLEKSTSLSPKITYLLLMPSPFTYCC